MSELRSWILRRREQYKDIPEGPDPTSVELVTEFHEVFGHPVSVQPTYGLVKFRSDLIDEEAKELHDELWTCMINGRVTPNLLKEIGDLRYVISGLCVSLGIDEEECVRRVHESNMSKLDENGKPLYRDDGKVLKSQLYKEPDMHDLVPKYE